MGEIHKSMADSVAAASDVRSLQGISETHMSNYGTWVTDGQYSKLKSDGCRGL